MYFSKSILGSIALAMFAIPLAAHADPGVYKYTGKGYDILISSDGDMYRGCDARKRCIKLTGGEQIGESVRQWTTKNKFVYRMEQVPFGKGKEILKVYNPQKKLILQRTMTPLNGGQVMSP
jgi:hypothetical protein